MTNKKSKKKSMPMRILDITVTVILAVVLIFLMINLIISLVNPDYVPNVGGFQLYTIVTDSMVPTIPVGSLVVAKSSDKKDKHSYIRAAEIDAMQELTYDEKAALKQKEGVKTLDFGTIIVFDTVLSSGKSIVITHYFDRIEFNANGEAMVYTYAEQFDFDGNHIEVNSRDDIVRYDGYEGRTKVSDIRAVYVNHVVWIGKFLLFLKSIYGIITVVIIAVVLIIGSVLIKKTEEYDKYDFAKVHSSNALEPPEYDGERKK